MNFLHHRILLAGHVLMTLTVVFLATNIACKNVAFPNISKSVECVLENDTKDPQEIAAICAGVAAEDVVRILVAQRKLEARRFACSPRGADGGAVDAARE